MGERRVRTPYRARKPVARALPVRPGLNATIIGYVSAAILFALIASSFIPLGHDAQGNTALATAASPAPAKDQ